MLNIKYYHAKQLNISISFRNLINSKTDIIGFQPKLILVQLIFSISVKFIKF